ncbi:acetylornithine deacetylase [Psychrobacter aestuarii]|uniref:Acetylornithine deacetylase n=1 Tax=Psychrobacter aestuarii TaxID=556327 RepID=A0ABP3FH28_9GAMM|nr:acetylornithine deacetylase [Psychrobacter aestuarii]
MNAAREYIDVLTTLISFDTTSYNSNLPLIDYVKRYLEHDNIDIISNYNDAQNKANLFISTGPKDTAGVLLSGHTDVVPVEGQDWDTDPFCAVIKEGCVYGRGAADMKGFIACALVVIKAAADKPLRYPLHLCLSYDEEIGCVGVRHILDQIKELIVPPRVAIIGEPTLMNVATSHKGKAVFQVCFHGTEGHSALAPNYTNAIHGASQFVQSLISAQKTVQATGYIDTGYDIPYSTIHVGKIHGGTALNVVPNLCQLDYEIRNVAEDSISFVQAEILKQFSCSHADTQLHYDIQSINQYPGLSTDAVHSEVVNLQKLLPNAKTTKLSFGTEAGLFQQHFDTPILVCGPGAIDVAHKPNEHIAIRQLDACHDFLNRLVETLV